MSIGKLQTNVGFLNWAVGVIFATGLAAIITSYLLLSDRIGDRYDKISDKLDKVSEQISDLRIEVTEVKIAEPKSAEHQAPRSAGR